MVTLERRFHGIDERSVPVRAAIVGKKDPRVFLRGLGAVQGTNTVVVRSLVDAQIDSLAFGQGQIVQSARGVAPAALLLGMAMARTSRIALVSMSEYATLSLQRMRRVFVEHP